MSKSKKRTVSCGGCGGEGHNKRTCPSKGVGTPVETTTATAEPPVTTPPVSTTSVPEASEASKPAPTPVTLPKPKVVSPREREAPTADRGSKATAAPYRCSKCNQVAILVIAKVKDWAESQRLGKEVFKGDLRCELCMNKPDPCNLILVWGAKPGQTVTVAEANA